ncbi:MAG: hypothetical protein JSV09_14565 [Thermoplasmata archaeon]|nr:MAG: hypothetical protein JSV09_14565 [Thermoplasmata archaeon]
MDLMLLFLILGGFVILLWLGIPLLWALCIIIFLGMVYLGLRYPRGKADWKYSFRETVYVVMTIITMMVFIIAIQAALLSIGSNIPSAVSLLMFFIIMPCMIILFLLGLFFPNGKAFNLKGTEGPRKL